MTHLVRDGAGTASRESFAAPLRAVDYLRVSTEEQAKGYGIAYTGKKTAKYIGRKGWSHADTYADEGFSGSLEAHKRKDLSRLMRDARTEPRPFDVVVVYEERAIGRRGRAFWPWVWELEDLGVFVAVVKDDYDNTTSAGRSKMRKGADYAEDEREKIRDRTQGGLQEKAEEGGYTGGTVPFGWRIQDRGKKGESRLVLDVYEEDGAAKGEAMTLRRARYLLVHEGRNWTQAAIVLNSEGLLTRSGAPWSRENLRARVMSRAVLEGVQIFRDPHSKDARSGRGTKLGRDGSPVFGATVAIKLDEVFTEEEVRELKAAAARIGAQRAVRERSRGYPLSKRIVSRCGAHYVGQIQTITGRRKYICSGKQPRHAGGPVCGCSQIDADRIEQEAWRRISRLLKDPEELMDLAREWADVTLGARSGHADRIEELDAQIAVQERAIATVMAATAIQAAQQGLDQDAATQMVTQATGPMNVELGQLRKLREEAVAWQHQNEAAERRARDLVALAERARAQMPFMNDAERADVIDLIDLKVTLQGPVPVRKGRACCAVGTWFKERDLHIPVEVPDAAWAVIEPLVTKTGRGSGKSTDLPARDAVEAILWKARTAKTWNEAARSLSHGVGKSLMSRWTRWKTDGTWERIAKTLTESTAIPAVPVPEPSNEPPLPDMLVEGVVDPRLFHTDDGDDNDRDGETRVGTVASRTTMSWQAAMTASAMPGCPSRRAAPGFRSLIN
ncbi:recombinase family protein [Streptomyces sp. NBC_00019]